MRRPDASRRPVEHHGLARQEGAQRRDARAHLIERRRLPADRVGGRVSRADDYLDASRGDLLHGLDRAAEHRDVARERIGHRGKQRQGGCVRRRQPQRDERVSAQQLAVEDPGAVEASGLDALDQFDQLRYWCRAGNPKRNLNARHGMGFYGEQAKRPVTSCRSQSASRRSCAGKASFRCS